MKKIAVLVCLLLFPSSVFASEFDNFYLDLAEDITINQDINGSMLIGADIIDINNSIDGVAIVFGNNIDFNSKVDYTLITGNNIKISNTIKDGVILGNNITLKEETNIDRDVVIVGSNVLIQGNIKRSIYVYADNVTIENANITDKIKILSNNLDINKDVEINKLSYNDNSKITIDKKADIKSKKTYQVEKQEEVSSTSKIIDYLVPFISLVVIFTISYWLLPMMFKSFEKKKEISKTIFSGLGFTVLLPIICLILSCSSFGIGLGLIGLLIYGLIILISPVITGYYLGINIYDKWIKKPIGNYLKGIIGVIILYLLFIIPNIGILFFIANLLFASGLIINIIKNKRNIKKAK